MLSYRHALVRLDQYTHSLRRSKPTAVSALLAAVAYVSRPTLYPRSREQQGINPI